jgi:lysophospholipase L1-like esterase
MHGASPPAAVGGAGAATAGAGGMTGDAGASGDPNAYAPCPAAPEPCKVLPFGDSITFGIGFAGGYRVELFRKALAAGQHIAYLGSLSNGPDQVDGQPFPKQNEGHSGWKIAQLEPLIPSPALATVPDIVLLMIGTNDIAQRDDLDAAPERLNSLLDKLEGAAPKALIVLAQITPLGNGSSEQAIETYNASLRAIVDKRVAAGEHIRLVDMYTGFPTSELGDGVHPNETGYARMAGVWYAAISGSLH